MAGFKSITTKKINILRDAPATPLWQRNYYEHIIRNPDAINKIRQYIQIIRQNGEGDRDNR